ncbi:autotransporter serine protease fusolisin [Fusobacterium canifelinum]|uniref:Autotransporter serine protease fusolisin n=1 Tax=Fusobacterium canifelinum TaxID=285729 RepID=A0A7T4KGP4_9FUSO|nr:autotransporter serine protease fusolisin [Fusobacterium canifelinum]QQB74064.1 autotransporter serine protease fusolisin [Fusobacterium canifelinum]
MGGKVIKNKLILIGLAAILLVSCGGSGGGGGSSNLPINPGNNGASIPAKPEIEDIINPTNPGNTVNPTVPVPNNPANPSNPVNNVKRESLEELRARMDEIKVREHILKEQSDSSEIIPKDTRVLNGNKVKVGVLDGDFINRKTFIENKFGDIQIIDRNPRPKNSDHGELVLKALREENKLGLIAGSIGENYDKNPGTGVIPKLETYEKVLEKFDPNQKVKVFSQSWGVPEKIGSYRAKNENDRMRALSSGELDEGRKIFNFYKEQVNKDSLFVWANGNTLINNQNQVVLFNDAYYQAGLPYLYSDLEKGWITVVGVKKNNGNILNKHYTDTPHLAYPGNAKWWAISADAEVTDSSGKIHRGSSFAAPRVARAAALVAEKYDWMTADQVRQTLFTTTDRTEIDVNETYVRNIVHSPDGIYGWGMLNQERALKGPGAFINIRRQYEYAQNSNNIFKADISENKISYFENDIVGDGGLEKLGKGTLHLTGNNSYERGSVVKEGTLEIHKVHASQVNIENQGTLVLHSKAIIGYNTNPYSVIDSEEITASDIIAKDVDNKGTVKVKGTTAIIGGDYIAHSGSKTEMDFSSKVRVLGKVDIQGGAITLSSNRYTTLRETATIIEASKVQGNISTVETNGMRTANVEVEDGKVVATLSRQNPVEYIGENAEASSKNVAENVEKVFQDLDQKVLSGTATKEELTMGSTLQNMTTTGFVSATEMMSGEVYASAQALTFSQAQNVNRDLSNRLAGLDNFKNSNKDSEVWFSVLGSGGKLRRDGYASADTRVTGGQFGIDTKFEGTTTLGVALNYSYAKANFNRYAGESKSNMVGVSFYGKQELPYGFYTAGRLGLSNVSSKVERELLTSTGETLTGKINHHDKMLSAYVEIGKKIGWFTPFIGYSQDYLRRGSFNESEASWGIKADSKNYRATNFLVGARAEYVGDKYKLQAYVTQAINTDKRDLTYEGNFTGSNVRQKFQGVKQAKNTTWIGFGVFREISPVFGVYGNVDFRVEDKKWADSVISTGLQYRF